MKKFFLFSLIACSFMPSSGQSWIRINQLGYPTVEVKVAVLCSKHDITDSAFYLVDSKTKRIVFTGKIKFFFGSYGPFKETCRLDFSAYQKKGSYFLRAADAISPVFSVDDKVYDGAADFCLRYIRQQRSGFNPFLKDSCHTHDGYNIFDRHFFICVDCFLL